MSADVMAPPTGQEPAAPSFVTRNTFQARSHLDTSLGCLTRKFVQLMKNSAGGVLDLNYACQILQVPKRRVYDVINVLEGVQLITKKMKNSVQWLGPVTHQDFARELTLLEEKEIQLDKLIQSCTLHIYQLIENKYTRRFAYLTHEDLGRIPNYKEQTVIVIKAPAGTSLNVPHPDESLCIHVVSKNGPIEAFLCPDQPDPDRSGTSISQNAPANGNLSVFQAASPSLWVQAKDGSFQGSDSRPVLSPPAPQPRHAAAATSPPSQCLARDHQQSFLSLTPPLTSGLAGEESLLSTTEDQGITDLFFSVDLDLLPV